MVGRVPLKGRRVVFEELPSTSSAQSASARLAAAVAVAVSAAEGVGSASMIVNRSLRRRCMS